jgi:hypothetical protein
MADILHEPVGEGLQPSLKPPQQLMPREVSMMVEVPPHELIREGPQPLLKPPYKHIKEGLRPPPRKACKLFQW